MKKNPKGILLFILIGIVAAAAIVTSNQFAAPKVAQHQAEQANAQIKKMLPQDGNDQSIQSFQLFAPNYLLMGDMQTAVRVFENDKPVQIIFTALSKKAYHSRIGIMAALDEACTIEQVDIISQKETPGLGDQYKKNDYAWLHSLRGKTAATNWELKPKGDIDAWTGATVTPKAITDTLKRMQLLCLHEHVALFSRQEIVYLEMSGPDDER